MRQMQELLRKIHIRNTKNKHTDFAFHASLHRAEIPSLEEILGVDFQAQPEFDAATEATLEKRALKNLEDRKKNVR